jgi:VanZ family protein
LTSRRICFHLPLLIWWLAIWAVSSVPSKQLPSLQILSVDKLAHAGVYLVLALLANRSLRQAGAGTKTVMLVYCLLLLNAGLDELHQYLIPGRSVSWWDFAANGLGLGAGFVFKLRGL